MKKDYFSFNHRYHKLSDDLFTTIRGKTAAAQYELGQEVDIIMKKPGADIGTGKKLLRAKIVHMEVKKLKDIPLTLLKSDGEFPGFTIHSAWDFIGLMNSLRKFSKISSDEDDVTVFGLYKIENGGE